MEAVGGRVRTGRRFIRPDAASAWVVAKSGGDCSNAQIKIRVWPARRTTTLAGVSLIFGCVSLVDLYFPPQRATRIDPLVILRAD
jgi:hypothetical protein